MMLSGLPFVFSSRVWTSSWYGSWPLESFIDPRCSMYSVEHDTTHPLSVDAMTHLTIGCNEQVISAEYLSPSALVL